jgi:hypothetical protein
MRQLTIQDVRVSKVQELGLDPAVFDFESNEVISAALRRVAAFSCPCSASRLVRDVVRPLEGLLSAPENIKERVESVLEAVVSYGDLVEVRDGHEGAAKPGQVLLYVADPSFVLRKSGKALIIGVAPDNFSLLPDGFAARIEYLNHIRKLSIPGDVDLRVELVRLGLHELTYEEWLKAPPVERPEAHTARLDKLLDSVLSSGDMPGLEILDHTTPVNYYRGRWTKLSRQTGRFVARRPQAYGAALWCYVEIEGGRPLRFLDLPLAGSRVRGCDEAWRLQMAIDALRGAPQEFVVRPGPPGTEILGLFSPVPMWAQRRWDAVGERAQDQGCLMAFRFTTEEIAEEMRFARDALWLEPQGGVSER